MSPSFNNPIADQGIRIKTDYHSYFNEYCRRHAPGLPQAGDADNRPFPRYVDMWFVAFCLGVRQESRDEYTTGNSKRIIDGSILTGETIKIHLIEMAAIAATENDFGVLLDPPRLVRIANEYANGGFPHLLIMLEQENIIPLVGLGRELLNTLTGD